MAMLTKCFFCEKEIVVPSKEKTYELTDYYYENVKVFENYKKDNPYVIIGKYCCEECFYREILPKIFR